MPDGRIVVAGHSWDGTYDRPGVARLLPNGGYDTSFDNNGRISFDITTGESDYIRDVVVLSNGAIAVAGDNSTTNSDWFVTLLTPDGTFRSEFGDGGTVTDTWGANDTVGGLALTPRGHLVIAGRVSFSTGDDESAVSIIEGYGDYLRKDDLVGRNASGGWLVLRSFGNGFENGDYGAWNPSLGWTTFVKGDFDGDGLLDVAGRDAAGRWWVGIDGGLGADFSMTRWTVWNEKANWQDVTVGDFDGDGRDDILARTGWNWYVARSTGFGFDTDRWGSWGPNAGWRHVRIGDFNGDNRTDVVALNAAGGWYVARSTGANFDTRLWDHWNPRANWEDVRIGDYDGDGRDDILARTGWNWYVGLSLGTSFAATRWGAWSPRAGWRDVRVADFNGDGRMDVAARNAAGGWHVGLSTGAAFGVEHWTSWNSKAGWQDIRVADFDGDGKDDIAGRTSGGVWYVARSLGSDFHTTRWGAWNEKAGWEVVLAGEFLAGEFFEPT